MTYPELRRGASGEEVVLLQSLLNRIGAMLTPDGDFGAGTEKGVAYAQDVANQRVTGVADSALWEWIEGRPEPSPLLSANSLSFIAMEETGGLSYYESNTMWPHFPGEESGITIGVGYDLKWNTEENFRSTWGAYLPVKTVDELVKEIGKKGAKKRAAELRKMGVAIPFKSAWPVFVEHSIPRFYEETASIFASLRTLPDFCRAVLVSLVFNRGASLSGERRKEMREIQSILKRAEIPKMSKAERKAILSNVEDQILSMKRLWQTGSGLVKRRQAEANLWRKGLSSW